MEQFTLERLVLWRLYFSFGDRLKSLLRSFLSYLFFPLLFRELNSHEAHFISGKQMLDFLIFAPLLS